MDPSTLVATLKRWAAIVGSVGSIISGLVLLLTAHFAEGLGLIFAGLSGLGLNLKPSEQLTLNTLGQMEPLTLAAIGRAARRM